jgi:hypothetical protein
MRGRHVSWLVCVEGRDPPVTVSQLSLGDHIGGEIGAALSCVTVQTVSHRDLWEIYADTDAAETPGQMYYLFVGWDSPVK